MNIPPGFAQVNLVLGGPALPRGAQMTYGLYIGAYTSPVAVLAESLVADWEADLASLYPPTVQLQGVRVKAGPNATGPEAFAGASIAGTTEGNVEPPNVAIIIRKNTDLGGRHGRGRMFSPGVFENFDVAGGTLTPTEVTRQKTAWDAFFAAQALRTLTPVLLHTATEILPTAVTSISVEALLATQRRRLRKVGGRRRRSN